MTDAANTITIQFVCPAERVALGTLDVEPGDTVTAEMIREYMDGATGRRDDAADVRAEVSDGAYALCPKCQSMLMIGLKGQDMDSILADRFVALVGSFRYADRTEPPG